MIRRPLYRQDEIVRICAGKRVLHLGFILHNQWREKLAEGVWLHEKILRTAARVVGVDYLHHEVEAIKKTLGCECYTGDVMHLDEFPLDEKFEVILCAELIEHIENPKGLLDGLKRFCDVNTEVVITTPNPWDRKWAGHMRAGRLEHEWINREHVAWYSMHTLKTLLDRCGFKIVRAEHYFEESLQLDRSLKGIWRYHWLAKRLARKLVTREQCQPGFFVVAQPKEPDTSTTKL